MNNCGLKIKSLNNTFNDLGPATGPFLRCASVYHLYFIFYFFLFFLWVKPNINNKHPFKDVPVIYSFLWPLQ